MEIHSIVLNEKDNVAVLTAAANPGDIAVSVQLRTPVLEAIPAGHKIAVRDIAAGTPVLKYGVVIGRASREIPVGTWVHTHNVEDITEQLCNEYAAQYTAKAKEAGVYGSHHGV